MEQLCSIRRRLMDSNVHAENLLQNHIAIMREINSKKKTPRKKECKTKQRLKNQNTQRQTK